MKKFIYLIILSFMYSCGINKTLIENKKESIAVIEHNDSLDALKSADSLTIIEVNEEKKLLDRQNQTRIAMPDAQVQWLGPDLKYIIICNIENRNNNEFLNKTICPYFNNVIVPNATLFPNWREMGDASFMNYIALMFGSRMGISSNAQIPFGSINASNLYSILKNSGGTVMGLHQDLPYQGYKGWTIGELYRGRHNWLYAVYGIDPMIMFNYNQMPADLTKLGNLTFVQFNEVINTHDASNMRPFDDFIRTNTNFQRLINFASSRKDVLLIFWPDENRIDGDATGPILVTFYGGIVKKGFTDNSQYNHYSLTKMISSWRKTTPPNSSNTTAVKEPLNWWINLDTIISPPVDTNNFCWKYSTKDTTIQQGLKDTTYKVPNYVSVQIKDSIKVACTDTITNPPINSIEYLQGVYVTGYLTVAKSKSMSDALIRDCKAKKLNMIHAYDWEATNLVDRTAIQNLNIRLRNEAGVKELVAVTQGANGVKTTLLTYQNFAIDKGDFDGCNFEYEPWRGVLASVNTMWTNNKNWLKDVSDNLNTYKLKHNYDYYGWWELSLVGEPMHTEAPIYLTKYTTTVILHCYRAQPDWNYMLTRLTDINKAATDTTLVGIIPSAEPGFSQSWFRTHTIEEFYNFFDVKIKSEQAQGRLTKIKLHMILVFTLNYLRVVQPTPVESGTTSVARLRDNNVPEFAEPGFVNKTKNTWALPDSLID